MRYLGYQKDSEEMLRPRLQAINVPSGEIDYWYRNCEQESVPHTFCRKVRYLLQHCCHNNWPKAMPYQPSMQGVFTDSSKGRSLTGSLRNSNKYASAIIAPPVHW